MTTPSHHQDGLRAPAAAQQITLTLTPEQAEALAWALDYGLDEKLYTLRATDHGYSFGELREQARLLKHAHQAEYLLAQASSAQVAAEVEVAAWPTDHTCPICGAEGSHLGTLGNLDHFRCPQCGCDFSEEAKS